MSETKKPTYTKALSLKDSYTLDEVISIAESIQNRQAPPRTKKGKELYNALEPFIEKKATPIQVEDRINKASVFVAKFYDKAGEVIDIRQSTLGEWDDGIFELGFIKDQARKYPPVDAVMCRIFASYDGRTLDPVPVSEFPIHELDLSTPDFHTDK